MSAIVHEGECLQVLRTLASGSVDSVVTDPPAGIGFMGKDWDKDKGGRDAWIQWMREVMTECLRVLKPGGHALVWSLPRTSHWTGMACELAGFEVRDTVTHVYSQGFPKSLDVSKAIDRQLGAPREVSGYGQSVDRVALDFGGATGKAKNGLKADFIRTTANTDDAAQWDGFGTALKPAAETWWLLRKPLDGTVAANVLAHGTGALNIDGCRVEFASEADKASAFPGGATTSHGAGSLAGPGAAQTTHRDVFEAERSTKGRWPANIMFDEEAGAMLDAQTGVLKSGKFNQASKKAENSIYGKHDGYANPREYEASIGGASRFFYCPKASKREKNAGLAGANTHPTVKPVALMRYLVRLITPPGGTVLDVFTGSGTTGVACALEGFDFVGIEREREFVDIARARISNAHNPDELPDAEEPEPDTQVMELGLAPPEW